MPVFPHALIEWHGHNDFYKAVSNSTTAWLYGCSGVNASLFGIGERTGNTPLEAMVFEYAQLKRGLKWNGYYGYHGAGGVLRKRKSDTIFRREPPL